MPGAAPHSELGTRNSVLVFGGTFDPPHLAHLLLAECARHQFHAAQVLFIPAGDPYLKRQRRAAAAPQDAGRETLDATRPRNSELGTRNSPTGPQNSELRTQNSGISPAHHRLAMLRLALSSNPAFVIDERELHRPGPSYTVDTLEELNSELGTRNTELVLLLGSDSVADLPNWRSPERIRELATIASAPNPATRNSELGTRNSVEIDCPALPISSTLIRDRVAAGLPVRYLVPDAVAAYIAEHGLYRGEAGDERR